MRRLGHAALDFSRLGGACTCGAPCFSLCQGKHSTGFCMENLLQTDMLPPSPRRVAHLLNILVYWVYNWKEPQEIRPSLFCAAFGGYRFLEWKVSCKIIF